MEEELVEEELVKEEPIEEEPVEEEPPGVWPPPCSLAAGHGGVLAPACVGRSGGARGGRGAAYQLCEAWPGNRALEHWGTGALEHWGTGALEHWGTGALGY